MAKRMGFSVVGLPHYTIWHLYEPSFDDLKHMEEMAKEKKAREEEEREAIERTQKIKEEFKDPKSEWEQDGAALQDLLLKDQKAKWDEQLQAEQDAAKPNDKGVNQKYEEPVMPKEKPQDEAKDS
jgi:mannan polymerase II complex ANP1 subunit